MARWRYSPEQIITILRETEVLLNQSNPVAEVCRKLRISKHYPEGLQLVYDLGRDCEGLPRLAGPSAV